MKALMSNEDIHHFENMIYLPMVLTIFHKDRKLIDEGEFKLKGPYQELIDDAVKCVESDLRVTKAYITKRDLKMVQRKREDFFTEFGFFHDGYEDVRRYMNVRLRNRTEELIRIYLDQATLNKEEKR